MKTSTIRRFIAAAAVAAMLTGCAAPAKQSETSEISTQSQQSQAAASSAPAQEMTFTDALGYTVQLSGWDRVASLYGSFAETWVLAGGSLVGATVDAVEERGMELGDGVALLGSVKEPNLEEIIAADPDFLILSADIAAQVDMHDALTSAGIPHAYYRVDGVSDYLAMLEQFCQMTGREDLYEENGLAVQAEVDRVLEAVQDGPHPTVLLLRAFSSGAKAKGDDNLAGVILRDLGAEDLVEQHESLLEDVSLEEVIAADPDFIFVVTMGSSEEAALDYMEQNFESNPAWAELTAVQEDHYVLLPKELFHYKPNARWGESYAYLAKILYPELAAEIG